MSLENFLQTQVGKFTTGGIADVGNTILGFVKDNQNRKHQEHMLRKQQEFTEKMARNKHSYEVESMLRAGLNPAMAQGTAQLASSPSAPSAPVTSETSLGANSSPKALALAERDLLKAEQENILQNKEESKARTRHENALADIAENDSQYRDTMNQILVAQGRANVDLTQEQRKVVAKKYDILTAFFEQDGVGKYLNHQQSQIALNEADAKYKLKLDKFVEFEAETKRLNARANMKQADAAMKQADVADFLKESVKGMNESQKKWYDGASQKEKDMAAYYAAQMALAQSEADLKALEAEARTNLGSGYACCMVILNDLLSAGGQAVQIATSVKSVYDPATKVTKNINESTISSTNTNTNHNYNHTPYKKARKRK